MAAGGDCSLVLTEGGRLLDLGGSGLYRDVEVRRGAPLPVRGLPAARRVASVSAGYDHCLCVDSEGGVWTWGAKGRTSPFNYVAPEGLAPPDQGARDAGRADRAAAAAAECAAAALLEDGEAGPVLVAARVGGVGQLGRRVEAAAGALDALPAARADRLGACAAAVAGGHFLLAVPLEGSPWAARESQRGRDEGRRLPSPPLQPCLYAASRVRDVDGPYE